MIELILSKYPLHQSVDSVIAKSIHCRMSIKFFMLLFTFIELMFSKYPLCQSVERTIGIDILILRNVRPYFKHIFVAPMSSPVNQSYVSDIYITVRSSTNTDIGCAAILEIYFDKTYQGCECPRSKPSWSDASKWR